MKQEAWQEVPLPVGFRAAGCAAGIKQDGAMDMALLVSDVPAVTAGVFTTNRLPAAPVKLCRERLAGGSNAQAVLVNSGNANAATGPEGLADARGLCALAAAALRMEETAVFMCSTGTIGKRLPLDRLRSGTEALIGRLSTAGGGEAARAILTTDTGPKVSTRTLTLDGRETRLTGMAKGAGMIQPGMATMLCFLMTDASVEPGALREVLQAAVAKSFNRISVDGDMSTNDTVLFLANGQAGHRTLTPDHPAWPLFREAVESVTFDLAMAIVADGEGATKVVTVRVRGAVNANDAERAARAVANSLLVKTSWVGQRANWGRVIDALGYCGVEVVEDRIDISYDGCSAARGGRPAGTPETVLQRVVSAPAFTLDIDLGLGCGEAVVYSCDCTEAYVRINR